MNATKKQTSPGLFSIAKSLYRTPLELKLLFGLLLLMALRLVVIAAEVLKHL